MASAKDAVRHVVTMTSCCTCLVLMTSFLAVLGQDQSLQDVSGLDIYSLHVETDVAFRFATTKVLSRLTNTDREAREATFLMTIPKAAFITSFVMTIDGQDYPGEVKEKHRAKKQYQKAKEKGESAGTVTAVQSRNTFQFRVSVNVAAQSKIDFNLTYQELLERRLGYYEYVLNINPGQVVRDVRVDVFIRETRDITDVRVPPIKKSDTDALDVSRINPDTEIMRDGRGSYHILYDPDEAAQARDGDKGISGQFVVQYDVARDQDAGEIQVIDGYFVHYFAPSGLLPLNKNVLFVIDVSGSMVGEKIRQTQDAMHTILDDLREGDMFNIITFFNYVSAWSDTVKVASPDNIKEAKEFISNIEATGGTDINDALMRAVSYLESQSAREFEKKPSMIIFLTDGHPTSGITSTNRITSNIRAANRGRYTIFSLGFGENLDFSFLQKISLQNRGFARRIYADSDANLQLEGFYNEVSTPVLSDVNINYIGDVADDDYVTDMAFPAYYRGSEIVVAGKLKPGVRNLDSRVEGYASMGYMAFDTNVRIPKVEKEALQTAYSNFTEKLWAYLTIRKLLNKMLESTNATEKNIAKQRALDLSLKYSFVTPLTSMVVTRPESDGNGVGDVTGEDQDIGGGESGTKRGTNRHQRPSYPTRKRRPSFVDNDPHFIVHVEGNMTDAICFNVDGPPGPVYQLIQDRISGTVVNGLVVGKKTKENGRKYPRTYIGELMIMRGGVTVHVKPGRIIVNASGRTHVLKWKKTAEFQHGNVAIFIEAKRKIFINLGDNIVIAVLRHLVDPNHKTKVDFLGMYVVDHAGLSEYTHGLIGQFLHQTAKLRIEPTSRAKDQGHLFLHGPHVAHRKVAVKRIKRRDMDRKDYVTCWNVRNNGGGLLDGTASDYIVPNLTFKQSIIMHKKYAKRLLGSILRPNNA